MSAIFLLVYWIIIPLLAIWLSVKLIRRANTRQAKGTTAAVCTVGLLWLGWTLFGGEKWWVDRQVRELCAKDGGIKVYETVTLSTDRFGQRGRINFYRPTQDENTLLLRPDEVLSSILDAPVLEVAHDTLWVLFQHHHVSGCCAA